MNIGSLFKNDSLKQFSINEYPLHNVIANLFDIEDLSNLHNKSTTVDDYNQDLGKDSNTFFHSIFYKSIKEESSSLRILWDKFLKEVVNTHFQKENPLIVQSLPSLRIHVPGAKAINRWHFDSDPDHMHPLGEINCLVPLTEMFGTNSVWRESEPGKSDFRPFELSKGDMVYWDGNRCTHGNHRNETTKSRLSLDFRIFPREKYISYRSKASKHKKKSATTGREFVIGSYYQEINK